MESVTGWYRIKRFYLDGTTQEEMQFVMNQFAMNLLLNKNRYDNCKIEKVLVLSEQEFEDMLTLKLGPAKEEEEEFVIQ